MRRIRITSDIEKKAIDYISKISSEGIRKKALNDLNELLSFFSDSSNHFEIKDSSGNRARWTSLNTTSFIKYISHLIKRYDALRAIHPKKFVHESLIFEKIVNKQMVSSKLRINGVEGHSLAIRIVKCMNYDKVRKDIFPKYIRELGINTCVYCNANYTISDCQGNAFYDLDHWKPKSYYPYLSTSFYNLQPSCPSCNRRKSNKDNKVFFNLWDDLGSKNLDVLQFKLDSKSLLTYLISKNRDDLKINFLFAYKRYKTLCHDMDECLHISARYSEHVDVLEEIIWKSQAYNPSYISSLRSSLSPIVPNNSDVKRFILGTYPDPDQIFKRPLARMIQNVAQDIGLL